MASDLGVVVPGEHGCPRHPRVCKVPHPGLGPPKVAGLDPSFAFVRVSPLGPLPQHPPDPVVSVAEGISRAGVAVGGAPPPGDQRKLVDYIASRCLLVRVQIGLDFPPACDNLTACSPLASVPIF